MKLSPKVKKSGNTNSVVQVGNLDTLMNELQIAENTYNRAKEELREIRLKVLLAQNAPVMEGSHVMCDLFIGRNMKKCKCLVAVDWDGDYPRFKVYPYKKEGGVSNKGYFAPENIKECLVEE